MVFRREIHAEDHFLPEIPEVSHAYRVQALAVSHLKQKTAGVHMHKDRHRQEKVSLHVSPLEMLNFGSRFLLSS